MQNWPQNVETVQLFPVAGFVRLLCQYLCQQKYCFALNFGSSWYSHIGCLHGLTFRWWGCCGLCLCHKPTELARSFLFCSCVFFFFMTLSTVFHAINSPDSLSLLSLSVLLTTLCFLSLFSRQVSAFSLCLISPLLVLSTVYLFMKASLSPDTLLCSWLGLKH